MKYKPVIKKLEVDDEHYYYVDDEFYPGVTKILQEAMPTPYALRHWIGEVGNEKAEAKLNRAADRGSRIHDACERLLLGQEIKLAEEFPDRKNQKLLVAFVDWLGETQPQIAEESHVEFVVASTLKYAGTLDIYCHIDGEPWIIDIKTSRNVYPSHFLQIAAYRNAFKEMTDIDANMGILHLKDTTKKGFQFVTEMKIGGKEVTTEDFMTVYDMYLMLNGGQIPEPPERIEYPEVLKATT